MTSFYDSLHLAFFRNAQYFAADLFYESFAVPFPIPREQSGLSVPTPPQDWRQQVAFYKWSEAHLEAVGFCNWIRYADCYLCGGLCVRKTFYRRLPREHWVACQERGGIALIMLETAFRELTDCIAWFGNCGDKRAYIVGMRAGFQPTRHPNIIVTWNGNLSELKKHGAEDQVAAIGPF